MSVATLVCLIPFLFQWNSSRISMDSTGMTGFLQDSTGIPLEGLDSCRNRWGTVKYWVLLTSLQLIFLDPCLIMLYLSLVLHHLNPIFILRLLWIFSCTLGLQKHCLLHKLKAAGLTINHFLCYDANPPLQVMYQHYAHINQIQKKSLIWLVNTNGQQCLESTQTNQAYWDLRS